MLNRRLWILFVAFAVVFVVIGIRLVRLQLTPVEDWRATLQQFVHRRSEIDTYRGSIVDRNGAVLAEDVPSDELAIDYRAMNLDDTWLKKKAIERLRAAGEWASLVDKASRDRRVEETKEAMAARIDGIPGAIGRILAPFQNVSVAEMTDQILFREDRIREHVHAVRQDAWLHKFERDNPQDITASSMGETGLDESALDAMFRQVQLEDEVASHTLFANIPQPVATYFKQHLEEFPGLSVRDNAAHNRRAYPFGEATAHIVGTLRLIDAPAYKKHPFDLPNPLVANDLGDLTGYLPDDHMGETGVERLSEDQLRGVRGLRMLDLSAAEKTEDPRSIEAVPGKTVKLTIDAGLQRDIYEALKDPGKGLLKGEDGKDHFVAAVVMSLDGQLLAVISYPSYDPNAIDTMRGQLNQDFWRYPLMNRAIRGIYHPGSTVKPLLAAAALTERLITPSEVITCTGHFYPSRTDIFKCDEVHGPVSMVEAIAKSCDIYFYTVGERLGVPREVDWFGKFGFGRETEMELPEAHGNLPDAAALDAEQLKNDALFMGIGQGPMDVSPLQMANAYGTLLRRGVAVAPRILADTPVKQTQAFELAPEILATVRDGMEHVTSEGTAKTYFKSFKLHVAGKTGTAETERVVFDDDGRPVDDLSKPRLGPNGLPALKPDGTPASYKQLVARHDDAWFVGYAPAEKPQFIVAAVMEWGGHGGEHAAPIVREAFMALERHGYLPRTDVP